LGLADPLQSDEHLPTDISNIQLAASVLHLQSQEGMIFLINDIGLVSSNAGLLLWSCFRVVYGSIIAIVAVVIPRIVTHVY